jgi:hypothetical protein
MPDRMPVWESAIYRQIARNRRTLRKIFAPTHLTKVSRSESFRPLNWMVVAPLISRIKAVCRVEVDRHGSVAA